MMPDASSELLPWLHPQWEQLLRSITTARIPPALLIQGQKGVGKTALARSWAQKLLCRDTLLTTACGTCNACQLFHAGTHPDFIQIEPAEPGKGIGIDTIRQLINKLSLKPQYNGYRVVLIEPAHLLNINASNALLKTLEEPSPYTLIILITAAAHKLPVTILSRCQKISVPLPERTLTLSWLQSKGLREAPDKLLDMAGGSPLIALTLDGANSIEKRNQTLKELSALLAGKQDPILLAGEWESQFDEERIGWISVFIRDLVYLKNGMEHRVSHSQETLSLLKETARHLTLENLYVYWDLLLTTRQYLGGPLNLRLVLEELLIQWWRMGFKSSRKT